MLENLGNLGEFVAALATLVTLIYLATQIRRNTSAVLASSQQAVADSFNELNTMVVKDAAVAKLYQAIVDDTTHLSNDEETQLNFLFLSVFRVYETVFYQSRIGTMEQPLATCTENDAGFLLSTTRGRTWWETNPFAFSQDFRDHIDALKAQAANAR